MTTANHDSRTTFVVLISLVAALGGFLFGFDSAVINGTVSALEREFSGGALVTGFAVGSILLGSALGAFYAGPLADRFGRRWAMIFTAVLFSLSGLGTGLSLGFVDFVLYRFCAGLAVGAASVIAPTYIAEVSPARLRGRLGSLQQLAIVLGIFISFLSNYVIAHYAKASWEPFWLGIKAWRWMLWAEVIPAVFYCIGAYFVPESPRYLVQRGRDAEAAEVLRKIGEADPAAKVLEIRGTLATERAPRLSDLLGPTRRLLPIVWTGILLSVFQQFVGINVVFYYGGLLWEAVGFSQHQALLINVFTGAVNVATTIVAMSLIDRVGRKPLLLAGAIGMALSLAWMAVVFHTAPKSGLGTPVVAGWIAMSALVAANVFVFCFGFSWGPVVWVLLGEMFPNQIRGSALSVSAAAQWLANFAITLTFPVLLHTIGLGSAYGLYALAAAVSFIFVLRKVRETKGMELEQMG